MIANVLVGGKGRRFTVEDFVVEWGTDDNEEEIVELPNLVDVLARSFDAIDRRSTA